LPGDGSPAQGGTRASGGTGGNTPGDDPFPQGGTGESGSTGVALPPFGPPTGGSSTSGGTSTNGGTGGGLAAGGSSANGGSQSFGAAGAGGTQGRAGSAAGGTAGSGATVSFATCPDDTWNLIWGDDFDGASGAAVDGSKWAYDSGPNWYNGELQNYTTGATNASLDGDGNLVIEAREEAREGRQYTSARLKTEGRQTFTYGRFEGRMKLPYGQGMWPAFWMLGGNGWPNDGEIDIMEHLGREPTIAHGTIHGPGYSGADGPGTAFTLPDGEVFSDDFHIFAVEWEPDAIRWYIDGEHYST
jgi:beta-glucanase (GH16 family)